MTLTLILLAVLLTVSGVFRAFHEAPLHDPDCGLNRWAYERFALSRPRLWSWLDSRVSHLNKYKWAVGRPAWQGRLLRGPLVAITDFWHLSYFLSNNCYDVALLLLLLTLGVKLWIALALTLLDSALFEPVYSSLRAYVKR